MLKKGAAILLLSIFLFNCFGYRLFTSFLQHRANTSLEIKLDNDIYQESQLISIKIPSNLPYYTNSKNYDRVNGQVTINGKHYNYVKRRMFNDSLEYLCIPNEVKTRLTNARDAFFELVSDLQSTHNDKPGSSNITVKNLLAEYCQHHFFYEFHFFYDTPNGYSSLYLAALSCPSLTSPEHPPDIAMQYQCS